ncbi:MAG: inorganic phosphate transporter [Christensenellales bacterium]|jgi:PiT family inorganic phosphate transporter
MNILLNTTLVSLTLIYTFYLGFNDGANAVASTITTRTMSPRTAILLAAASKFITPLILFFFLNNLAVSETIQKVVSVSVIESGGSNSAYKFLLAGLLATIIWSFFTYFRRLPNSGSHTLLGGIVGSAVAAYGLGAISWNVVLFKVILMAILAPVIALIVGFLFMRLFRKLARSASIKINGIIRNVQVFNVVLLASSFSLNNVQKSLGVLLMIISVGSIPSLTGGSFDIFIMLLVCGAMLTIGMLFGGYRIINTVGNKIFKLKPFHSVVEQISTGVIVYASSFFGIPLSTSQVVASTIMGVGASERLSGVQWLTAKKIFTSWFITFPISFILGALLYLTINLL